MLNAPVERRWSSSKMSCSSLGRRGGDGPCEKGLGLPSDAKEDVVERERICEGRDIIPRWRVFESVRRREYAIAIVFGGFECVSELSIKAQAQELSLGQERRGAGLKLLRSVD